MRTRDENVDNEGQRTTRRDEYEGNKDDQNYNDNDNGNNGNDDNNKDNKMTRTARTRDEDTTIKKRTRTMRDDNDEG